MILFAGTSGYGFREWTGAFYPKGTRPSGFLAHYGSVFNSVEINHTFRRFPQGTVVASWAAAVPPGFRFAVKAHQGITHRARLRDAGASVRSFLEALAPLGERLGPVLFQCPPWLRRDDNLLDRFLADLPADGRFALEFRHDSWRATPVEERCREAGVALTAAVSEIETGFDIPVTSSFGYVRLRRDPPYQDGERRAIGQAMARLDGRVDALYLYVKHDGPGLAPEAVSAIRALAKPPQSAMTDAAAPVLTRVEFSASHFRRAAPRAPRGAADGRWRGRPRIRRRNRCPR